MLSVARRKLVLTASTHCDSEVRGGSKGVPEGALEQLPCMCEPRMRKMSAGDLICGCCAACAGDPCCAVLWYYDPPPSGRLLTGVGEIGNWGRMIRIRLWSSSQQSSMRWIMPPEPPLTEGLSGQRLLVAMREASAACTSAEPTWRSSTNSKLQRRMNNCGDEQGR